MKFRRNIDLHTLQGPFISDQEISKIIGATKRGEYLAPPETEEDKARREIAFLLHIAEQEWHDRFIVSRLAKHPDVINAGISGYAVEQYAQRLVEERVIKGSGFRQGSFRIIRPEAYDRQESGKPNATVLNGSDGVIDGTIIDDNHVPELVQRLLPVPTVPEQHEPIEHKILRWAKEGKSRNEMAREIGGTRKHALDLIRRVLGPARKGATT
jgi:hypothetical protein